MRSEDLERNERARTVEVLLQVEIRRRGVKKRRTYDSVKRTAGGE